MFLAQLQWMFSLQNHSLSSFDADDFGTYVERNYGLKMHIVDGKITDKFDIVDEKLYTFFILKWK